MSLLELFRKGTFERDEISQVRESQEREVQEVIAQCEYWSRIDLCVRAGLSRFGGSVSEAILYNLRWLYGMDKEEIAQKPQEFEKCLDLIFRGGSYFVKRGIIDEVKNSFGLDREYSSLKDCFDAARTKASAIN